MKVNIRDADAFSGHASKSLKLFSLDDIAVQRGGVRYA